jgi:hypothetical protein
MALLRPKHRRRRTSIRQRPFTTLSCPFNGHQVSWCRQLCEPVDGRGYCGRIATHDMLGRTQVAILGYKARRAEGLGVVDDSVDS